MSEKIDPPTTLPKADAKRKFGPASLVLPITATGVAIWMGYLFSPDIEGALHKPTKQEIRLSASLKPALTTENHKVVCQDLLDNGGPYGRVRQVGLTTIDIIYLDFDQCDGAESYLDLEDKSRVTYEQALGVTALVHEEAHIKYGPSFIMPLISDEQRAACNAYQDVVPYIRQHGADAGAVEGFMVQEYEVYTKALPSRYWSAECTDEGALDRHPGVPTDLPAWQ